MKISKLRIARVSLGLTQTNVSSLSGGLIPQHRVSELERGMPAKPEEAATLLALLGLPIKELGVNLSGRAVA
jgi:transcriptional regulator with XRE-family HTH domain